MAISQIDWTPEEVNFVEQNLGKVTQKDMIKALKYSYNDKTNKASELGFLDVKSKTFISMEYAKFYKKNFKVGQRIKLKAKYGYGRCKVIKGIIVSVSKWLVVVQGQNYRESFKYVDFWIEDVEVM